MTSVLPTLVVVGVGAAGLYYLFQSKVASEKTSTGDPNSNHACSRSDSSGCVVNDSQGNIDYPDTIIKDVTNNPSCYVYGAIGGVSCIVDRINNANPYSPTLQDQVSSSTDWAINVLTGKPKDVIQAQGVAVKPGGSSLTGLGAGATAFGPLNAFITQLETATKQLVVSAQQGGCFQNASYVDQSGVRTYIPFVCPDLQDCAMQAQSGQTCGVYGGTGYNSKDKNTGKISLFTVGTLGFSNAAGLEQMVQSAGGDWQTAFNNFDYSGAGAENTIKWSQLVAADNISYTYDSSVAATTRAIDVASNAARFNGSTWSAQDQADYWSADAKAQINCATVACGVGGIAKN